MTQTAGSPPSERSSGARQVHKRLVSGAAFTLIGRLSFGVAVILQNMVLSRLLGADEFGAVLLVQSISLPAGLISLFGLDVLAIRDLRDPRRLQNEFSPLSFLRTGALLIGMMSIPVAAALLIGLGGLCYLPGSALSCAAFGAIAFPLWPFILLTALQMFLAGILRGIGKISQATLIASVLATYIFLASTLAIWLAGLDIGIRGVLILQCCSLGVGAIFSCLSVLKTDDLRSGANVGMTSLTRMGPSLMATQLLALLVTQADVWVVSVANSPDQVAFYGVAARIAQLVSLPHLVLGGVLPPMIAEHLANGKRHELEDIMRPSVTLAAIPSIGLAIVLGLFGPQLLAIAFGPAYAAAALPLAILSLGNVVNVMCGPCSQALILSGNQMTLNVITVAMAIFVISGGLLASIWFGALGVAVVFAAGLTLQGFAGSWAALRRTGVKTYADGSLRLRGDWL